MERRKTMFLLFSLQETSLPSLKSGNSVFNRETSFTIQSEIEAICLRT